MSDKNTITAIENGSIAGIDGVLFFVPLDEVAPEILLTWRCVVVIGVIIPTPEAPVCL